MLIIEPYLQLSNSTNQHLRNLALQALDQSICAVLGSDEFQNNGSAGLRVPSRKVITIFILNTVDDNFCIVNLCCVSLLLVDNNNAF